MRKSKLAVLLCFASALLVPNATAIAQPAWPPTSGAVEASRTLASGRQPQNMCADCIRLREKLRIVADKVEVFDEGLEMLQRTQRVMNTNRNIADGFAAAYAILQSLNVSIGLATLPCAITQQWLKGLLGGAAGLGAYVQEGDGGGATLAAIVSYIGFGVVSDAVSTYEFLQQYRDDSAGLRALRLDLDRTIREFQSTRDALRREGRLVESDLSRAGCPYDPFHDAVWR